MWLFSPLALHVLQPLPVPRLHQWIFDFSFSSFYWYPKNLQMHLVPHLLHQFCEDLRQPHFILVITSLLFYISGTNPEVLRNISSDFPFISKPYQSSIGYLLTDIAAMEGLFSKLNRDVFKGEGNFGKTFYKGSFFEHSDISMSWFPVYMSYER